MNSILMSVTELQKKLLQRPISVVRALMADPVNGSPDTADKDFLPNTVNFDIDGKGSDHDSTLPHCMPSPETLAIYLGALGLSEHKEVVIYDNRGMFCAPRLWWMLKSLGHERAFLLDGGLPAWQASGLPVNSEQEKVTHNSSYTPAPEQQWFASGDQVLAALDTDTVVIDARSEPRFNGDVEEPRPGLRRGHIPGAINIPFQQVLEDGKFKTDKALQAVFAHAGVALDKPIICSCGSGVTACVVAVAALLSGATNVQVYDGAWSEWGADSRYPVEV